MILKVVSSPGALVDFIIIHLIRIKLFVAELRFDSLPAFEFFVILLRNSLRIYLSADISVRSFRRKRRRD